MTRIIAALAVAVLFAHSASAGYPTPPCEPCYKKVVYYETVTCTEYKKVPYEKAVTKYDHCGKPYTVYETCYKEVPVTVTKQVPRVKYVKCD